jgi:hypothetical protein
LVTLIILLPTFITAKYTCENDDDCPEVLVYDPPLIKNLLPSIYKCVENICVPTAVKWILAPRKISIECSMSCHLIYVSIE